MQMLKSGQVKVLACSLTLCLPLLCQDAWMNDREVMQGLRADGVPCDRDSATLYFEKDAMTPEDMDAFSDVANQGVKDIEKLLKIPPDRSRAQTSKVYFFISSKFDIGHSRFRSVMLPLWRVQQKVAPYLHESTHVLTRCGSCPMWFSEGFASWVQSYVSETMGGYDAKVFARHGNPGVDADAARYLSSSRGQAVLPFVLEGGEPPDILAERRAVGAPFYVLSQSLVKYLVQHAGIDQVMGLTDSEDFDADLARIMKKEPADVKAGWLAAIREPAGSD